MALRKLRKMLKPVIWVIVVAFIASIFALGIGTGMGNRKQIGLKVNGEEIEVIKIENRFNQRIMEFRSYYQEVRDPDFIRLITMSSLIDEKLLEIEAKKRNIRVSRSEEKAAFEQATANIPTKDELVRRLRYQGMNITDFKRIIKDGLIAEKTRQSISNEYSPSSGEITNYYEENKDTYGDKPFEEVENEIIEALINKNKMAYYNGWIEKKRRAADIEVISARYNDFLEKPVLKINDYLVFNTKFYEKVFMQKIQGVSNEKDIYERVVEQYKDMIVIADEAKGRGLKGKSYLTREDTLFDLRNKLEKHIKKNYEYTDEDIYEYFKENESRYERRETAKIKVIPFEYIATEEDKAQVKENAQTILNLAKDEEEEFEELAKKYSEGPTASEGGYLGWFPRGSMVSEFEEAVFNGEIGIYPEIVKTNYGYHIINILDRDVEEDRAEARHILLTETPSLATIEKINENAAEMFSKIEKDEDFEELLQEKATVLNEIGPIEREGRIGEIGFDRELNKSIFNELEVGDIELVDTEIAVYIVKKTEYTPFEPANYEQKKEVVKDDFLNKKMREKLNELTDTLKQEAIVQIIDPKIEEILIGDEKSTTDPIPMETIEILPEETVE